MRNNCSRKLHRSLFVAIILAMTAAFCCYAQTGEDEFRQQFLEADQEELEEIEKLAASRKGTAAVVRQDFLYLNENVRLENEAAKDDITVVSEVYAGSPDLAQEEMLIGNFCFAEDTGTPVEFTFRYFAEDKDAAPAFETEDGTAVRLENNVQYTLESNEEGYHILTFRLSFSDLKKLSFYTDETIGQWVLKPVSDDKLVISSISCEAACEFYCAARLMLGSCLCDMPFATLSYDLPEEKSDISFQLADEQLKIQTETPDMINLQEIYVPCEISEEADVLAASSEFDMSQAETEEKDPSAQEEATAAAAAEEEEEGVVGTYAEDLTEVDVEEKEYLSLEEGTSSTVYADSYLFTRDGEYNHFYRQSGILGLDLYLSIFGLRGFINADFPELPEDELSGTDLTSELPANVLVLTVADCEDSEFAGQMNLRLEGEETDISKKVIRVASPSDAIRPEEEGLIDEAGTDEILANETIANETIANETLANETFTNETFTNEIDTDVPDTEIADREVELDALTIAETNEAGITAIEEAAATEETAATEARTVLFCKAGGSSYAAETGTTVLSEAFLKKASYCALDADGFVCAVYNEHGRLVRLAEGYTEEDVARYVLLPYAELTEDGADDLYLAELTITYNDVLAEDDIYATVTYRGDDGLNAEAGMTVSAYADTDSYLDLLVSADHNEQIFYLTADGVEAQLQVDLYGEYALDSELESGTTLEEDGDAGAVISADAADEIVYLEEEAEESAASEEDVAVTNTADTEESDLEEVKSESMNSEDKEGKADADATGVTAEEAAAAEAADPEEPESEKSESEESGQAELEEPEIEKSQQTELDEPEIEEPGSEKTVSRENASEKPESGVEIGENSQKFADPGGTTGTGMSEYGTEDADTSELTKETEKIEETDSIITEIAEEQTLINGGQVLTKEDTAAESGAESPPWEDASGSGAATVDSGTITAQESA